jgi:hypothetical protein
MFCAPILIFGVTESCPIFMFSAPGHVFDGAECVGSHFHVLCARTLFRRSHLNVLRVGNSFWRYRGRRILFSCFALEDMFSTVRRASGPVIMFCAPGTVFDGNEGVGSRFHVLRAQNRFRRYRWRRVPISCFVHLVSFSAVPRASGPVFMFCAPGTVFAGIEGVGSRFHVLLAQTHFRRYRGRRVLFSLFARPDSFSTVSRASGPVFMFCASGLIFGCAECVGSRFHDFRPRSRFRRYGGCRVPLSCFACLDSFSTVPRASCPVFMF